MWTHNKMEIVLFRFWHFGMASVVGVRGGMAMGDGNVGRF